MFSYSESMRSIARGDLRRVERPCRREVSVSCHDRFGETRSAPSTLTPSETGRSRHLDRRAIALAAAGGRARSIWTSSNCPVA